MKTLAPEKNKARRKSNRISFKDRRRSARLSEIQTKLIHHTLEESSKVDQILAQLSDDELERAACASSYAYIIQGGNGDEEHLKRRNFHASKIIRRYLESKKGNVDVAIEKVRSTLEFRREKDVEGLVRAFDKKNDDERSYQIPLQKHLSSKKMFVQGYDRDGRATLIFTPRLSTDHDVEWTLKEALYSIERALACSKAKDGTINAVVDFSGFSVTQAPPLDIGKQFLTALRSHYCGQINKIFLLDTPFAFGVLWKVFKPFVGTCTRDKIHFVSGDRNKTKKLGELYELDEVPNWMVPGGKKNRELDLEEYLFHSDFDMAFAESDLHDNN